MVFRWRRMDLVGRMYRMGLRMSKKPLGFKLLASAWYSSAVSILKPIDAPSITKAIWKKKTGIQSSFFQHSKVLLQLSWRDLKFLIK